MRSDFYELFLKDAIGFGTKKMVDFILMSVFMSKTQNMNNVDCLQSEYRGFAAPRPLPQETVHPGSAK